jgi:hypothetical protein
MSVISVRSNGYENLRRDLTCVPNTKANKSIGHWHRNFGDEVVGEGALSWEDEPEGGSGRFILCDL